MLTVRERVMTGKRQMRGEQIRGDTSAVGVWKCSCQDVLIVWTCGKSFLKSFLSLSATRGNKAPSPELPLIRLLHPTAPSVGWWGRHSLQFWQTRLTVSAKAACASETHVSHYDAYSLV